MFLLFPSSPCASLRIHASFLLLSGCKHSWSGSAHTQARLLGWSVTFLGSSAVCCGRVGCCRPVWGGWEQIGGEDSFKKKRLQILFSVRRWNVRGRGSLCARGFLPPFFPRVTGLFYGIELFWNQPRPHTSKKKTVMSQVFFNRLWTNFFK